MVKGTADKRKLLAYGKNVEVHHYDWLIEKANASQCMPRFVDRTDVFEI
jgi:hypothetical protein